MATPVRLFKLMISNILMALLALKKAMAIDMAYSGGIDSTDGYGLSRYSFPLFQAVCINTSGE